jgi:hypothetical protein
VTLSGSTIVAAGLVATMSGATGCWLGFKPECSPEAVSVDKDERQPDGITPAEFMEGLEGERAVDVQWLGRNDEADISFRIPDYATDGILELTPDWESATQLDGGGDRCDRPQLTVDFTATFRTSDGALDHTFELQAIQEAEVRELPIVSTDTTTIGGTLQLEDPQPPEVVITDWLLQLDCTELRCEGEVLAVVDDTPFEGVAVSVLRVPIARFVAR